MGVPAWRCALIRKLKAGEHSHFGGNHPDADKANLLIWLKTGMRNDSAPDFKVVVRPDWRTAHFVYRLYKGALGFSAGDHDPVVEVTEGVDF